MASRQSHSKEGSFNLDLGRAIGLGGGDKVGQQKALRDERAQENHELKIRKEGVGEILKQTLLPEDKRLANDLQKLALDLADGKKTHVVNGKLLGILPTQRNAKIEPETFEQVKSFLASNKGLGEKAFLGMSETRKDIIAAAFGIAYQRAAGKVSPETVAETVAQIKSMHPAPAATVGTSTSGARQSQTVNVQVAAPAPAVTSPQTQTLSAFATPTVVAPDTTLTVNGTRKPATYRAGSDPMSIPTFTQKDISVDQAVAPVQKKHGDEWAAVARGVAENNDKYRLLPRQLIPHLVDSAIKNPGISTQEGAQQQIAKDIYGNTQNYYRQVPASMRVVCGEALLEMAEKGKSITKGTK